MRRSLFLIVMMGAFLIAAQVAAQNDTVIIYEKGNDISNASAMIGSNVVDRNGEDLGMIEDVLFAETGEASYLVISQTDAAGEQVIPIPLEVADPQRTVDGDYVIDVDRRTLASAPAFTRNEIGDYAEADLWQDEVRGYFGVQAADAGRAISDRQEVYEADIDRTIDQSKESGGLNGTWTGYRDADDRMAEQPRAYFPEDRYEPDMGSTIERSKESGGLNGTWTGYRDTEEEMEPRTRAYFGDDRYEPDMDATLDSSKESGGLNGAWTGYRDRDDESSTYSGRSTEY